jgi:hypothetical protein
MPWPPRRTSSTKLQLQHEVEVLQLKLLRVNSALAIKTQYASRLEYLLHERLTRIDELNAKLEQQRQRNWHLEIQAEVLTQMIAAPPIDATMLFPK